MKHFFLSFIVLLAISCRSDLRPDSLSELAQPTQSLEEKGRQILARTASTHGIERFKSVEYYDVTFTDDWVGFLGWLGHQYPQSSIEAKSTFRAHTFDSTLEFLHEEDRGLLWGVQSWKSYKVEPGDAKPDFEEDSVVLFILPAIHFFSEMLFHDHSNALVAYAGKEKIDGVEYDRVFLSWNSMEATSEFDQYLLYINPENNRFEKLRFTIRDRFDFAEGTIHFEDIRNVEGVLFPFRQSFTSSIDDNPNDYIHRVVFKNVNLDSKPITVVKKGK